MSKISFVLAFISISIGINAVAEGAEWMPYYDNQSVVRYYDTQSIKDISKDIWRVWTKDVLKTQEQKDLVIENRFYYKQSIKGYEDYSYQQHFLEINCSTDEIRMVSSVDYNKDDNILATSDSATEWRRVVPESIIEKLFNIVCKSGKK